VLQRLAAWRVRLSGTVESGILEHDNVPAIRGASGRAGDTIAAEPN
jgi:hypothetical protein